MRSMRQQNMRSPPSTDRGSALPLLALIEIAAEGRNPSPLRYGVLDGLRFEQIVGCAEASAFHLQGKVFKFQSGSPGIMAAVFWSAVCLLNVFEKSPSGGHRRIILSDHCLPSSAMDGKSCSMARTRAASTSGLTGRSRDNASRFEALRERAAVTGQVCMECHATS